VRRDLALLGTALIAAAVLRIGPMLNESVWLDEMFTRHVVLLPAAEALQFIRVDKTHPPVYYVLERISVTLLGDSPAGLRMLSLLSSLGLVAAAGLLARALTGGSSWAGFSAAALVAVSDSQIAHAFNARSYALYSLQVLLLAWAFHHMVLAPGRRGPKVAYALLAMVAVLTHYLVAFYLLALGPAAMVAPDRRRALRNWVLMSLPSATALGAWWLYLRPVFRADPGLGGLSWIAKPGFYGVAKTMAGLAGLPIGDHVGRLSLLFGTGFLALLAWIYLRRPSSRLAVTPAAIAMVVSLIVVPPALLLTASLLATRSFWVGRQLLPSQAFVAIGAGMGIAIVARRHPAFALAVLAALVVLSKPGPLFGPSAPRNAPYNLVAADLRKLRGPGEVVAATEPSSLWSLNYYLQGPDSGRWFRTRRPFGGWVPRPYPSMSDASLSAATGIWLVSPGRRTDERDSLVKIGWQVETTLRYATRGRPGVPGQALRVEKLRRP